MVHWGGRGDVEGGAMEGREGVQKGGAKQGGGGGGHMASPAEGMTLAGVEAVTNEQKCQH